MSKAVYGTPIELEEIDYTSLGEMLAQTVQRWVEEFQPGEKIWLSLTIQDERP